jgi:arylsulfatase A-like enzyme
MADDAIDWMIGFTRPIPGSRFSWYAPGATHAPHHPTKEWVDKISAMHLFDDGYEKLRERIFENQKKLGVIPQDEELTPWPNEVLRPGTSSRPKQRSSTSGRLRSSPPTPPTTTTRSAG